MTDLLEIIFSFLALIIFCAGFKSSVFHGGPGLFELTGMLWRGEIKSKKVMRYTDEEREAVEACAIGIDAFVRVAAVAAHRALNARVIKQRGRLPYGDPHFEFMREIDTPCPDYSLRAALRAKVIAARRNRM